MSRPTIPGRLTIRVWALAVLTAGALSAGASQARTLSVGAGQTFPTLAEAAKAAEDGDTISIAPGTYYECLSSDRANLVIEGAGNGVVLTDRTCQDKAILVLGGDGGTVRNLTLQRARVPDGNGAGIRLEAPNLLVEHVTFSNNQVGLLSSAANGTIRLDDCTFLGGGVAGSPLAAIMVGAAGRLHVERSRFTNMVGGAIASSAAQTELLHDDMAMTGDGTPPVSIPAGTLALEDSVLTIGPQVRTPNAAVALGDEATGVIRRNRLVNRTGAPLALVLDWSHSSPTLEANTMGSGDREVATDGLLRHRASTSLHGLKNDARTMVGPLARFVRSHL